jgi:hypothetical protein
MNAGARGGAAASFSGLTNCKSGGRLSEIALASPSLFELSSFRKRLCSAICSACRSSESRLTSRCNRSNSPRRTPLSAIEPIVITAKQDRTKRMTGSAPSGQPYKANPSFYPMWRLSQPSRPANHTSTHGRLLPAPGAGLCRVARYLGRDDTTDHFTAFSIPGIVFTRFRIYSETGPLRRRSHGAAVKSRWPVLASQPFGREGAHTPRRFRISPGSLIRFPRPTFSPAGELI